MTIDDLLREAPETLRQIFARNGIKAPVTKENVTNAVLVVPAVKAELQAKFSGFMGVNDNYDETEFDGLVGKKALAKTPEQKAARNAKIKALIEKGVSTVKGLKSGASQQVVTEEEKPKEKSSKILGLESWLFYSIITILALVIIFIIVKAVK